LARRRTIAQADAVEPFAIELRLPTTVGANLDGLEEGDRRGFAQLGMLDVFGEVALERVMAGHLMELAALLVEPHPETPLLVEDVGQTVRSIEYYNEGEGPRAPDEPTVEQVKQFTKEFQEAMKRAKRMGNP
jgi:hypothetical protein